MADTSFNLPEQNELPGIPGAPKQEQLDLKAKKAKNSGDQLPEKLGKAIRLPVPDFSDPNRPLTCLEVDFPITQINALSQLEGNAGKPIYQMSKWWARRRSSVFRSMLIAAATKAPDDPTEAAKLVWDHYYSNHQKAGSFKKLRVLDPFMGGGTTLVEGSRLGMQMTGVDLNPVAWFVVKNELACSDPEQVKNFFEYVESEVKPQIQPFYTTTCPRGHKGRWIDVETGASVEADPIALPPSERKRYRWEGPEVIYTFWAKHGPCQAKGCGHRTPIFRSPVIAEKSLSTSYIEISCPACGHQFHADLGETRMAPGAERVVLESEPSFTEMTQDFAQRLKDYDKGNAQATIERALWLKENADAEPGLHCPKCEGFSGRAIVTVLERHIQATKVSDRKKKHFNIRKKPVQMFLLIHPDWIKGASGFNGDHEVGGWAGASSSDSEAWHRSRLDNLAVIEVRGKSLPPKVTLRNGVSCSTEESTTPQQSKFTCGKCGRTQSTLDGVKLTGHTASAAAYVLQCYCPKCEAQGFTYGGRYFKSLEATDVRNLGSSESEWASRKEGDLNGFWPHEEIQYAHMTHERNPLPDHGYTHWWTMFNARQLLVHSTLLKVITNTEGEAWPLDIREQAVGAFQQYLRNQNMFCMWDMGYDKLVPMMSNANFNPKTLAVENCSFQTLGRGNWMSCATNAEDGVSWAISPTESMLLEDGSNTKSVSVIPGDPVVFGSSTLVCASSTDLHLVKDRCYDLIVTDPPFGNNVYYADMADFFYVWLRIPLQRWYLGTDEQRFFIPERTPHAIEAIDNPAEHPDVREVYEKDPFITPKYLDVIRHISGDASLCERDPNPTYRPEPSSDFYCQTLTQCWGEAARLLKPGGIMSFTFHHSEDAPWVDVLRALFDAGYLLIATYPIRSDETKGENAAFGSKKIEYDIIHVCRKRLIDPEPVSWARMRRWVKDETERLKTLLEHTHGKNLPDSDLRVILRGKALEFYSRHYGQVFTGDQQVLDVRDALLGINQLLDDLIEGAAETGHARPPESAEPASRLYLRIFHDCTKMVRDELHKTLRGTGVSQPDLEARGWIRAVGRDVHVVPIKERFTFFTAPGRTRKQVLKTDLDQAHFLIGAACLHSGVRVDEELNRGTIKIKKSVDDILKWYAEVETDPALKTAATTAASLLEHWRTRPEAKPEAAQMTIFDMLEESSE